MKTYVVTGATSGIGQALSLELAQRGHPVVIVGRRLPKLQITAAHYPDRLQICQANIATRSGRQAVIAACEAYDSIAGLIHNAGTIQPVGLLADIDERQWRSLMRINVEAPMFITQGLLTKLSGGRILHLSSLFAHVPATGVSAYCMSKAALYMLYQCINLELQAQNIVAGSVSPGVTDTPMQGQMRRVKHIDGMDFYRRVKAENRLVPTATVAKFLAWLLCDIDKNTFAAKEWDIYDNSHHQQWLGEASLPMLPSN